MYYPYFRGKQYELIAIRETSEIMADSGIIPVIEPVRESLSGLKKSLNSICNSGGTAILVVNPSCGELQQDGTTITELLSLDHFQHNIYPGILLTDKTTCADAQGYLADHEEHTLYLIHSGFLYPKELASTLEEGFENSQHIFIEGKSDLLYRKTFSDDTRILIRDGFEILRNADYTPVQSFSELHITYTEMGMQGFGDFLIVGNSFSEGGGPAYAVAIHITFIDHENDSRMFISHFKSDDNDTPTNPARKFKQALEKLIKEVDKEGSKIKETSAIAEFRNLHESGHFPGLGYVKKLSLKHHIETMADFLRQQ